MFAVDAQPQLAEPHGLVEQRPRFRVRDVGTHPVTPGARGGPASDGRVAASRPSSRGNSRERRGPARSAGGRDGRSEGPPTALAQPTLSPRLRVVLSERRRSRPRPSRAAAALAGSAAAGGRPRRRGTADGGHSPRPGSKCAPVAHRSVGPPGVEHEEQDQAKSLMVHPGTARARASSTARA
jgi:hypothetical protein